MDASSTTLVLFDVESHNHAIDRKIQVNLPCPHYRDKSDKKPQLKKIPVAKQNI